MDAKYYMVRFYIFNHGTTFCDCRVAHYQPRTPSVPHLPSSQECPIVVDGLPAGELDAK